MKSKILDRKYICTTGGVIGPFALCGKVSVAHDNLGHRCCAHGNVKCKHKRKQQSKGEEDECRSLELGQELNF